MAPLSLDAASFRQALGRFPTGVVVVTAMGPREPVGLAVGSFTSVSLEPPLVAFCPAKGSRSWPIIEAAGAFCVNVLAQHQEDVCRRFASKTDDKFEAMAWKSGHGGAPRIEGALAWVSCDIDQVVEAGDHYVVIGRVRELEVGADGSPLVFFRGGYGRCEMEPPARQAS